MGLLKNLRRIITDGGGEFIGREFQVLVSTHLAGLQQYLPFIAIQINQTKAAQVLVQLGIEDPNQ